MPVRVQLLRKSGWRMPPNTVSVARPSVWGNPFTLAEHTRDEAVQRYRAYLTTLLADPDGPDIQTLRGKNLACWCRPGEACHADVLLEIANSPIQEETP